MSSTTHFRGELRKILCGYPLLSGSMKRPVFPLQVLTLKAPITTAADNNFFFIYFSEKTSVDISCEIICLIFQRKQVLTFHVNCLLGRQFT